MVWLELGQPAQRARCSGCITLQFDAFFFSLHMFVRLGMLACSTFVSLRLLCQGDKKSELCTQMNLWVLVWLFAPQAIETHGQKLNKSIISMGMLNLMTLTEAKQNYRTMYVADFLLDNKKVIVEIRFYFWDFFSPVFQVRVSPSPG